jgi:ribosomal protein L40E
MMRRFELLTSEQLLRLHMSCPRCAAQLWIRANFCGRCTLRVNDGRYFQFLADRGLRPGALE